MIMFVFKYGLFNPISLFLGFFLLNLSLNCTVSEKLTFLSFFLIFEILIFMSTFEFSSKTERVDEYIGSYHDKLNEFTLF